MRPLLPFGLAAALAGQTVAPELALADLQGLVHRLADARGKIVVLEWLSHRCPTIAYHYENGIAHATRTQLRGDDLVWWSIDSSRTTDAQRAEIAAWRTQHGHDVPYLLDPRGTVGRAFGAARTPHLFVVDAAGRIAYAGAWTDRDREVDYVAAAVTALRQGRPVPHATTVPRGCGIDYADGIAAAPRTPFATASNTALTPAVAAWESFHSAMAHAAAGRTEPALAALAASFAGVFPTPADVLTAPAFAALRRDDVARPRLRALLRAHAVESRVTMVAADEPGEAMLLLGAVRAADGSPLPGARVFVYHTDARGLYSPTGDDNARLFAWVRTDGDGNFAVRTIRPAAYPDQAIDQHVHFVVAPRDRLQVERRIGFTDDPFWRTQAPEERPWIVPVERGADGLSRCRFVLHVP